MGPRCFPATYLTAGGGDSVNVGCIFLDSALGVIPPFARSATEMTPPFGAVRATITSVLRQTTKERPKAAGLSGIEVFPQLLGNECALLSSFQ